MKTRPNFSTTIYASIIGRIFRQPGISYVIGSRDLIGTIIKNSPG